MGPSDLPLHIGVFGNIDYLTKAAAGDESGHGGFHNGALDLYVTSQLSERWSGAAELVYENENNEVSADLERFQLTYGYSDALQLSVGRVHNPIVRWNVDQHHGLFMQTPIDRPSLANWEDVPGAWPTHFVGLLATGQFASELSPRYAVGVGNGRGATFDQVQVSQDQNAQKAITLQGGIQPRAVPGLELYLNGYVDDIPAPSGPIKERIGGISGTYNGHNAEVRGEWSRIQHTGTAMQKADTSGWYLMLATRLSGKYEHVKPYVMLDRQNIAAQDTYFSGIPDVQAWVAGARFDIDQWVALKADYRSDKLPAGGRDGSVRFQLAFSFR